jgi:xanthine dehydrogenase accessory factor
VTVRVRTFDPASKDQLDLGPNMTGDAYIFGCGHVGQAAEPVLRYVGFRTIMVDDRPGLASRENFPDAAETIEVASIAGALDEIDTDDDSYLFVLSYSQDANYRLLLAALARPHAYIGLLGSRRKIKTICQLLEDEGIAARPGIDFYAPIGDDISAETPEEIGVSIAAQAIRVRAARVRAAQQLFSTSKE